MTTDETMKQRMARVRAGRKPPRKNTVERSTLSDNDVFLAQMANDRPERVSEPIEGEKDGVTEGGYVWYDRPGTVTMYKPTPQGFFPRTVTKASTPQLLNEGWLPRCPDCGGSHGPEPNVCTGKDPVAIRICPVCGKKQPDNSPFEVIFDDDDPNVIRDEAYENSTPATRTKAQLDLHLWTRHPQEARALNIAPLPEVPETVMGAAVGTGPMGPVQGAQ